MSVIVSTITKATTGPSDSPRCRAILRTDDVQIERMTGKIQSASVGLRIWIEITNSKSAAASKHTPAKDMLRVSLDDKLMRNHALSRRAPTDHGTGSRGRLHDDRRDDRRRYSGGGGWSRPT